MVICRPNISNYKLPNGNKDYNLAMFNNVINGVGNLL